MVGHLIYFAVVISTAVTEATSQAKCENAFSCWKGEKRGVCTGIGQTINATKDNEMTCWCEEYKGYAPDRPKECWEQGTPSACVCTQCPNGAWPIIRKENCEFITEFNKEEHCATPGSTITTSIPISDNAQGKCNSGPLEGMNIAILVVAIIEPVIMPIVVGLCICYRKRIVSWFLSLGKKKSNQNNKRDDTSRNEQTSDATDTEEMLSVPLPNTELHDGSDHATYAHLKQDGKAEVF